MAKTFAEKIREKRVALKLTLEEVASKIGSTKSYVWELENKDKARPSAEKLLKLADALELSPHYLLDNEQETESVDDAAQAFYRKFGQISENDREILLRLMNSMPVKNDGK